MAVRERERFGMPGTTLTRKDSVSQLDERKALIKSWYKGTLLAPSPENGDHALFNAPVFVASISNKQRFFFISRVMNHRQQASVTDRSTHFYYYELEPETGQAIKRGEIPFDLLRGNDPNLEGFAFEDLRVTPGLLPPDLKQEEPKDGWYGGVMTAEKDNKPHSARMFFRIDPKTGEWRFRRARLMKGLAPGKNGKLITSTLAYHRNETDSDRISIYRQGTNGIWTLVREIPFYDGGRPGLVGSWKAIQPDQSYLSLTHRVAHTGSNGSTSSDYSLWMDLFQDDVDGIPRITQYAREPFLTYEEVWGAIVSMNPDYQSNPPDRNKKVIYALDAVWANVNGKICMILLVTFDDRQIEMFQIPERDIKDYYNKLMATGYPSHNGYQ